MAKPKGNWIYKVEIRRSYSVRFGHTYHASAWSSNGRELFSSESNGMYLPGINKWLNNLKKSVNYQFKVEWID